MNRYFFILGKNPTLSLAEIIAVLEKQKINYSVVNFSPETAIAAFPQSLDAQNLIKTLGGTIKIGKIIDEVGFNEDETKFNQVFSAENLLKNYFPGNAKKLHFGVSVYNAGGNPKYVAQLENQIKDISLAIKKNLQEKGIKSGFLRIKERFLSSVSVFKNKLLTEGAEIVFIITKDYIMVGKTQSVQEFASFSFRDYSRPARDKRSGIMPPKLARIMINLAQIEKEAVILDPFCGGGTILQEAAILGYKNITGSDNSSKAVSSTKRNIDWLIGQYPSLKKQNYNLKVICQDVKTITEQISSQTVDTLITEPYLGPPLYKKPDIKIIKRIIFDVGPLYLSAFSQFARLIKPKGKIVIIFPAFFGNNQIHLVEILDELMELGFSKINYIPSVLSDNSYTHLTKRHTILYGGPEYFIQREILIFQKI